MAPISIMQSVCTTPAVNIKDKMTRVPSKSSDFLILVLLFAGTFHR